MFIHVQVSLVCAVIDYCQLVIASQRDVLSVPSVWYKAFIWMRFDVENVGFSISEFDVVFIYIQVSLVCAVIDYCQLLIVSQRVGSVCDARRLYGCHLM